jgi:hypothetical protein
MGLSMADWRNQFKARGEYWRALLFAALIGATKLIPDSLKIKDPWPEGWRWTLLGWIIFIGGGIILFKITRPHPSPQKEK